MLTFASELLFSAEFASLSAAGSGSDRDGKSYAYMDVSVSDFPLPSSKSDLSVFTIVKFSLNIMSFKSTQIYFNTYCYLDYFILD